MIATQAHNNLLTRALSATRLAFVSIGFFSLCINLLMLTAPLFMLQVFDRVLSSRSEDTLLLLLAMALFALAVLGGLDAVRGVILSRIGAWVDTRLSLSVFKRSLYVAVQASGNGNIQGLRDIATLRSFITGPSVMPLLDIPWMPIFIGVIFLLHPLLGWVSLAGGLLLFILALVNEASTRKPLQISGVASMRALRDAELAIRNADVIHAMGMAGTLADRWQPTYLEGSVAQSQANARTAAMTASSKSLRLVLQVTMMATGAVLVLRHELTPGAMIAASILMGRALGPVEQAISAWKLTVLARQAFARLKQQLLQVPDAAEPMSLPAPAGDLRVEGVTYFHPGAEDPALYGLNYHLPAGHSLAIIGPTAAGKTTLARVLIGNLTPRIGRVRLDEMDVAKWDREDLGRHVGYLPQDVELFSGTVAENIARLAMPDADQVIAAARLAGVHELVLRLPKGYDTQIGPDGAALSGGQRQRIGFARALYGDPRLVILDEPNSNLDGEGELALAKALQELRARSVTVVVITQRSGVLAAVDEILVLNHGKVQAAGPRDEILRQLSATAGSIGPSGNQEQVGGVS